MTPEQEAVLRDVQVQLRGPGLTGWPQLSDIDAAGARTVVDALGAALRQIAELRTEIGDLEITVAELARQLRPQNPLPWPLSLLSELVTDPAAVIGEQIQRWESLFEQVRRCATEPTGTETPALPASSRTAEVG